MLSIHVCAHKFFYGFPLMVSLGLSAKNNPKNHMGKDKYRDKSRKEEFLLCNTKGLLTVILKDSFRTLKDS